MALYLISCPERRPCGIVYRWHNTSDSRAHIDTWNKLRALAGRSDFLYVADSKLCLRENMDHIDRAGGQFVTMLPRTI
jgi:transposase